MSRPGRGEGFPSLVPQGPRLIDSISAEIRSVGGPQGRHRTYWGHVPRLPTAFTLAHTATPTRRVEVGASTSSSNDRHRGWGHSAGRQNSGAEKGEQAGRVEPGGGHEHRTCWGQESGTVCGEPTPGAWVQDRVRCRPCPAGAPCSGRPSLPLPHLTGQSPQARCLEWNVRCKRQGPPNRAPAQEHISHVQQGQHSPN